MGIFEVREKVCGEIMMERKIAVSVKDVFKTFNVQLESSYQLKDAVIFRNRNKVVSKHVLNGISFDILQGESVAIIGGNGCGKSTTLKLLSQIMQPDSGSIRVSGRIACLIELGAGFHPDMTGRENIYINASIFGFSRKEIDEKISDIIEFSELGQAVDMPVRTYSSGMYMRLAFSVAINVSADILLVDEILAVGDAHFQSKCIKRILDLKHHGVSIVLVSHSMQQVKMICDKTLWLDCGKVRDFGETDLICKEYLQHSGASCLMEFFPRRINTVSEQNRLNPSIDRSIQIESVVLLNGREGNVFWREKVKINILFKNSDTKRHLKLRIAVWSVNDTLVGAALSKELEEYKACGEHELFAEVDVSALAPGRYYLCLVFYGMENGVQVQYESVSKVLFLAVEPLKEDSPISELDWVYGNVSFPDICYK